MTVTTHDIECYADVDLYGVLHLTTQASPELIDRVYRLRVHAVHPDHAGAPSTNAAALVNAAGAILREPEARARYDALRAAWRAKHQAARTPPSSGGWTSWKSS
jgi:curved DNA-binding protein CbpA